jgi:hypothetical protein
MNITNLGKPINTSGNEEAPFISNDGKFLYFSSDAHESLGNMDIFVSGYSSDSAWSEPRNLGAPINSTGNDVFFTYFENNKTGFLAKELQDGFGKNDIYILMESVITSTSILSAGDVIAEMTQDTESQKVDSAILLSTKIQAINDSDININSQMSSYLVKTSNEEKKMTNKVLSAQYRNDLITHDSLDTFTIQIIALKNPIQPELFMLSPLTYSLGEDGLTRYSYGEYPSVTDAEAVLTDIKKLGFLDAFIRKVSSIENYKVKSIDAKTK